VFFRAFMIFLQIHSSVFILFKKSSSFQNSFDNYLSTNINIHCLYIFGLLFLLENEKKLIFVDFSLLSQTNSQHPGIFAIILCRTARNSIAAPAE
jgi:hypothetical protein